MFQVNKKKTTPTLDLLLPVHCTTHEATAASYRIPLLLYTINVIKYVTCMHTVFIHPHEETSAEPYPNTNVRFTLSIVMPFTKVSF